MHDLKREVFDTLKPDLVIVSTVTGSPRSNSSSRRTIAARASSLRRATPRDVECALRHRGQSRVRQIGWSNRRRDAQLLDHAHDNEHLPSPTPRPISCRFYRRRGVDFGQCVSNGEAIDFATVGQVIAQAVAESDLRVVLIASVPSATRFTTCARCVITKCRREHIIPKQLATLIIASSTRGFAVTMHW